MTQAPVPTLGRIVHYRGFELFDDPRAAVVVGFNSKGDPNLHVYASSGLGRGFYVDGVPMGVVGEGITPTAQTIPQGTWCWPPRV